MAGQRGALANLKDRGRARADHWHHRLGSDTPARSLEAANCVMVGAANTVDEYARHA